MTVTCDCSGKNILESYTKQVSTGKNEKEVFEENVITKLIKFKIEINLTSIIKFSYFIFVFILHSTGKICERKNFMDISFNDPYLIGIIK